jgi:acetylornithine deacetylase/succinyl-diaminopimelate desuccinylase-like protein
MQPRMIARIAKDLIASLLGLLAGSAPVAFAAQGPLPPEADRALARAMFKELVEIDTQHASGSTAAAEAIRANLLEAGFAAADVTLIAPEDHPTKGNLIVRYAGSGRTHGRGRARATLRPILFMGHLDVVDARAEDWSVDPFKLTEQDGWFYGRGSIDMKNGDAAMLESLVRMRREHFVPARDLIVAFTADEEGGGDANGPAFLLQQHRDLIDAETAFNLDGGGGAYRNGERAYFRVGTSEKIYLTYTAEASGPGGHGSLPGPDNPIYRLGDALGRLEAFRFPVQLTDTTRASFLTLAAGDPVNGADMRAVAASPPDEAAADRLSRNVRFNAQLRTTCVATMISGGHAENALPLRARAVIQCRLLPADSEAHVRSTLIEVLADPKVSLTLDAPPILSPESPPGAELARIGAVVHSMWPGVPIVPTMSSGFSDGRQTRSAGIPTYDVGGVWIDVDENRMHGRDERIGTREFDESVEYTYRLMKAMTQAP